MTIDDNLKEGCEKAAMAGARDSPKLDMEHGFIQNIIKNQVDRDEYDKEQKALSLQKKISGQSRPKKRAPLQMYVPPHLRAKAVDVKNKHESESSSKGKKHIFCCIKELMREIDTDMYSCRTLRLVVSTDSTEQDRKNA